MIYFKVDMVTLEKNIFYPRRVVDMERIILFYLVFAY